MIDFVEVQLPRRQGAAAESTSAACGGCVETARGRARLSWCRYSSRVRDQSRTRQVLSIIFLSAQPRAKSPSSRGRGDEQVLWISYRRSTSLAKTEAASSITPSLRPVIGLDQTSWNASTAVRRGPWQIWCVMRRALFAIHTRRQGAATFKALVAATMGSSSATRSKRTKRELATARYRSRCVLGYVYRNSKEAAPDHQKRISRSVGSVNCTKSTTELARSRAQSEPPYGKPRVEPTSWRD